VTKNKKWRDVSSALSIGGSSSAGFTLRKNYAKYLFAFECRFDRGNVDPLPILAQIDANSKKDSKRSSSSTAGLYLYYHSSDQLKSSFLVEYWQKWSQTGVSGVTCCGIKVSGIQLFDLS